MDENSIHNKLKQLISFAPFIKNLYVSDALLVISDLKKVIHVLSSKEIPIDNYIGHILEESEPMYQAMRKNERIVVDISDEVYGHALRTIACPVLDDDHQVIGSIAIGLSVDNQENLIRVAEQLAISSEEISSSTSEMSASSNELMNHMRNLIKEHKEMNKQVDETMNMLDLIHSISKRSRILGLNASIEAARSGEHGRGFDIVAKEITKLADQSEASVKNICEILYSFREKVAHVEEAVTKTTEISEHQSKATSEIMEAIRQLTAIAEKVESLSRKI